MISLEDWAEIRYLHRSEGLSRRAIAKRLGISRDAVARAIASQTPPKYSRVSGPSAFDPFEPYVRELLAQFPMMPASVIAERVGWSGSQSWWRKKVAGLSGPHGGGPDSILPFPHWSRTESRTTLRAPGLLNWRFYGIFTGGAPGSLVGNPTRSAGSGGPAKG